MAKSINAQRIAEDVALPDFEPPTAEIWPCIMAVSQSGVPLDFAGLRLWQLFANKMVQGGNKIGPASWLFRYLNDTFPACYFRDNLNAFVGIHDWEITTLNELRHLHFARMAPRFDVQCEFQAYGGYPSINLAIPTPDPRYAWYGKTYPYEVRFVGEYIHVNVPVTEKPWPTPYVGDFGFTLHWSGDPLFHGVEVTSHYHPPSSILSVFVYVTHPPPRGWRCDYRWYSPEHRITIYQ